MTKVVNDSEHEKEQPSILVIAKRISTHPTVLVTNRSGEQFLDLTSINHVHNWKNKLSSTTLYQYEQNKPKLTITSSGTHGT
jgi:hypothetical protein